MRRALRSAPRGLPRAPLPALRAQPRRSSAPHPRLAPHAWHPTPGTPPGFHLLPPRAPCCRRFTTEGGSAPALILGFSSTSIMKGAASCMAMLALPYLGVL